MARLGRLGSKVPVLSTPTQVATITAATSRASAPRRGYDRAWQALRDAVVIERGCRCECGCGRVVVLRRSEAVEGIEFAHVDHIVPVSERPDLRLVRSNLRVLAQSCHNARTAQDQRAGGVGRISRAADRVDRTSLSRGDFWVSGDFFSRGEDE